MDFLPVAVSSGYTTYVSGYFSYPTQGYDEVKLWEVPGAVPVATPFQGPGLHGPTSAMIWLDFSGCPSYLLVFGTGIGVVVAWQHDRQVCGICA